MASKQARSPMQTAVPDKEALVNGKDVEVEIESDEEETTNDKSKAQVTPGQGIAAMMQDPRVLAAMQGKLQGMVGSPSGYIQSLPAPVQRRIKALKNLQYKQCVVESQFYREVHDLEKKYLMQYQSMFDKRKTILSGKYEPVDDECDWPSEPEDEDEDDDEMKDADGDKDKKKMTNEKSSEAEDGTGDDKDKSQEEDVKGIPEFWLTALKNVEMMSNMIHEHDEPSLQYLEDLTLELLSDPLGFKLNFYFGANPYFSNTVLTKHYHMKCELDEEKNKETLNFDGPEIYKCDGCKIDWKDDKNLTVRKQKKVQKNKSSGQKRTVTKLVPQESFFNFFNPPEMPDDSAEDEDNEIEEQLVMDYEVGNFIRERLIPRAVLYFTGEAVEESDMEDDEDDEESDEDGDDEDGDDESDTDYKPKKGEKVPQDCKQQ